GGEVEDEGFLREAFETAKSYINPKNWGVDDYTDRGTFDQAFEAAKKAGEPEFMYDNVRYSTEVDNMNRQQEFETYGITSEQSTQNNWLRNRIQSSINPDESMYGYKGYTQKSNFDTALNTMRDLIRGKKTQTEHEDWDDLNQDIFNLYLGKPVENR